MPAQLFHQRSLRLLLACAIAAAAACGSDAPAAPATPPPPPGTSPTTGMSISTDSASALQVATVGTVVHVSVHLKNADGSPAVNQPVSWIVTGGGGAVAAASSTTDANGAAKMDWTIGKTAGSNSLSATITGASSQMLATGNPDVFAALARVSSDSQQVVSTASTALVVKAADQYGNGVSGIAVAWTNSGGTLSPASTITGSTGNATITFTTADKPATYTVTATAKGTPPISFTVKGV
jgi:hypothetical protein